MVFCKAVFNAFFHIVGEIALSGVTVAEITFFAIVQSFMLYVTDKL